MFNQLITLDRHALNKSRQLFTGSRDNEVGPLVFHELNLEIILQAGNLLGNRRLGNEELLRRFGV
jgi:hypothetical protein